MAIVLKHTLEEISFVPALAAFGGVFAAVSTFQGKILLNSMFSEPSISQETIEELANNAISCIVKCLLPGKNDLTWMK